MSEQLIRPRNRSVNVARPMVAVLRDDSQTCTCALVGGDGICNPHAMRVIRADYEKGGIFL
jgi:hypothetical protein